MRTELMLCPACGKEFPVGLLESVRSVRLECKKCSSAKAVDLWSQAFDKRIENKTRLS